MAFKGVVRFNLRCTKHVRFNPDTGGRSAVRGGCIHCQAMCDVADMARKLRLLVKETEANIMKQHGFENRAEVTVEKYPAICSAIEGGNECAQ